MRVLTVAAARTRKYIRILCITFACVLHFPVTKGISHFTMGLMNLGWHEGQLHVHLLGFLRI